MGIQTEFNPDLALRNFSEFTAGRRKKEECLPENPEAGQVHEFLKKGQRIYWLMGEIPLVETKGNQQLSRPVASVILLEAVHFLLDGEPYTKGKYRIAEVFNPADKKIHFDGFNRVK
ncbi:MAG: hypothetical protein PHH08_02365 [Candidatus ainarchaeum sp.]|nr:hypothetical protein [Candidatus ainarchaeum sp.]